MSTETLRLPDIAMSEAATFRHTARRVRAVRIMQRMVHRHRKRKNARVKSAAIRNMDSAIRPDTLMHLTSTKMTNGSVTLLPMIRDTTWIILGNMAISLVASVPVTSFISREAVRPASGSTAGIGVWPHGRTHTLGTGSGIQTRSSSMKIRTIPAGISPTTPDSELTSTLPISGNLPDTRKSQWTQNHIADILDNLGIRELGLCLQLLPFRIAPELAP